MLYRIYTENKNRNRIIERTSQYFRGFTIYDALGYWHGNQEKSLVIEINTDNEAQVKALALDIKAFNHQNAVLIIQCLSLSTLV